ncbi:MAG: hypothetical protein IPO35_12325 [Uliginosibacterium sp.]|nr:hypothetical protein [Uliginosibacterium sp.]
MPTAIFLKKQSPDGNSTTYGWDSHNRLIRVDTGSQKTEYERDAQGQRIKTRVTGGKTVETQHLIDEARPYAEVVLDKTGSSETRYLHPGRTRRPHRRAKMAARPGSTTPTAKAAPASSPTPRKASRKSLALTPSASAATPSGSPPTR